MIGLHIIEQSQIQVPVELELDQQERRQKQMQSQEQVYVESQKQKFAYLTLTLPDKVSVKVYDFENEIELLQDFVKGIKSMPNDFDIKNTILYSHFSQAAANIIIDGKQTSEKRDLFLDVFGDFINPFNRKQVVEAKCTYYGLSKRETYWLERYNYI